MELRIPQCIVSQERSIFEAVAQSQEQAETAAISRALTLPGCYTSHVFSGRCKQHLGVAGYVVRMYRVRRAILACEHHAALSHYIQSSQVGHFMRVCLVRGKYPQSADPPTCKIWKSYCIQVWLLHLYLIHLGAQLGHNAQAVLEIDEGVAASLPSSNHDIPNLPEVSWFFRRKRRLNDCGSWGLCQGSYRMS